MANLNRLLPELFYIAGSVCFLVGTLIVVLRKL